jgi:small subunit ribosomal protein S11
MGKKRIIKEEKDKLIKESDRVELQLKKDLKLKVHQKIKLGRLYISSSYNNTIFTLTDDQGNVVYWTSAGRVGFEGTKKGTPYAASKAAEIMAKAILQLQIPEIEVLVKGVGAGRDSALRTLAAKEINIVSIKDVTPIPHDGPRPPKVRRV